MFAAQALTTRWKNELFPFSCQMKSFAYTNILVRIYGVNYLATALRTLTEIDEFKLEN